MHAIDRVAEMTSDDVDYNVRGDSGDDEAV